MSNRMAPRPCGSSSGEQPITASAASVSRSITSSRMPVSAATRSRKPSAFERRAAGFGRDQPQALGLPGPDLVAANAQGGDGAFDRGLADAAGRRDALAEPDDPRERIDHAKAVAGRTGDQQAAIVGAKVQRRIDAGSSRRQPDAPRISAACAADPAGRHAAPAVVSAQPKAVAKPRVIFHPNVFPWPSTADEEFPFTETLAARSGGATAVTWDHAQSGVVVR